MDYPQQKYRPVDLIRFLDSDSEFAGVIECPNTIYNIGLIGKEADGLFAQANEIFHSQDLGCKERYEEVAAEFERIAGFRPEAVYEAEEELRKIKGLGPSVDIRGRPIIEGLNTIRREKGV